jgi:CHAD domain-containing protein
LKNYERLLKPNTKVRDIDIVLSKLPHHGDDPKYAKPVKQLNAKRKMSIEKAKRFASSLKEERALPVHTNDLSGPQIQNRFKKTARTLTKRLKKGLRVVTEEPKNLDELHRLREDSRRLRFTLEIDDTPETSKLLPVLETWQDVLGKIRDADIFITQFQGEKDYRKIREVLEQEKSGRNENYERFLEIAKESPSLR